MQEEKLSAYIRKRLAELDSQKDLQEIVYKGRLSFGVDSTVFGHLPAWKALVKQKKHLVKWIWIDAFLVSVTIIFVTGDYYEKFAQNWLKATTALVLLSGCIMLFYVITAFYTLFYKFRKTEREIRKLIYQDILFQVEKEKTSV
ncbi:MAG TPA: hypothetical protein VFT06_11515 [Flavisolibacter sp.]|nr:hypothetical protein [Flavisolibacter sp.]